MDGNGVMKLDILISDETEETIFRGALEVLKSLRPTWPESEISYKMLTDGITNKLVRCMVKDAEENTAVLIRIYGNKTDLLIDRNAETRNIEMLNKFGLAPNLYATFKNGLAYEYVPGCTLTNESVRNPKIYKLIARQMAKLHKIHLISNHQAKGAAPDVAPKESVLWTKLDNFSKLVPDKFSNKHIHEKFLQLHLSKERITQEVQSMKSHLSLLGSPVVFCHNDLLLGNVIYTPGDGSSKCDKVSFIDFEYADFNYQAFDIGDHFAEFAGVDNVDYNNYPDKELQYAWLTEYAAEFYAQQNVKHQIDVLYVQVNCFALASHLLWGIWALIQAEHSSIDFDFIEYSWLRLSEYFRRKEEFLSLQVENSC